MYIIHIYIYVYIYICMYLVIFSRYNTYRHIRVVNMMVTNDQKCGRETSPMESTCGERRKIGGRPWWFQHSHWLTGCEFTGSGWGLWFSTRKWMFTIGFWHGLTWYNDHNWLVVYLPLWRNVSSSVGMMKFPTEWENKTCSKPPTRSYHTASTVKKRHSLVTKRICFFKMLIKD